MHVELLAAAVGALEVPVVLLAQMVGGLPAAGQFAFSELLSDQSLSLPTSSTLGSGLGQGHIQSSA